MTDEEIDSQIAQIFGWNRVHGGALSWWEKAGKIMAGKSICNSLDAIAKVLATIHLNADPRALPERWRKYRDCLAAEMGCAWYQSAHLLRATAKQQALAFLRLTEREKKEKENE